MRKVNPVMFAKGQEATLVVTLVPLTLKLTWTIFGLGTLVKKVIVTNVLEPTFSLNVNTTNVLTNVHA